MRNTVHSLPISHQSHRSLLLVLLGKAEGTEPGLQAGQLSSSLLTPSIPLSATPDVKSQKTVYGGASKSMCICKQHSCQHGLK